jgi:hypothetical protein
MGYSKLKDLVQNCYVNGQNTLVSFRKVPAIASVQGSVVDFSMAPGNPRPNFYTGNALEATLLTSRYGIWTGGDVSPQQKILRKITMMAVSTGIVPMELFILDYLMFYPLIDMDSTDPQEFINYADNPSIPRLPRYSDGSQVMAFLIATNPYVGGAQFTITYTNHKGESGRTSRLITTNTNTFIGTVVHSGVSAGVSGTFIDTPNDEGIRSVESIQFMAPNGGLAALVLCKVLSQGFIREITTPAEWDFLLMKGEMPIIYDGAYINCIGQVNGSVAGQVFTGLLETIYK